MMSDNDNNDDDHRHSVCAWVRTSTLRESLHLLTTTSNDDDESDGVGGGANTNKGSSVGGTRPYSVRSSGIRSSSVQSFRSTSSSSGHDSDAGGDGGVWGWTRCLILSGTVPSSSSSSGNSDDPTEADSGERSSKVGGVGGGVTVLIRDVDSEFDGRTIVIPPSLLNVSSTSPSSQDEEESESSDDDEESKEASSKGGGKASKKKQDGKEDGKDEQQQQKEVGSKKKKGKGGRVSRLGKWAKSKTRGASHSPVRSSTVAGTGGGSGSGGDGKEAKKGDGRWTKATTAGGGEKKKSSTTSSGGDDEEEEEAVILMANDFTHPSSSSSSSQLLPPDDLIRLTHLHEPSLVHSLRLRYQNDVIYTDTGPILLALNPFKSCDGLYGNDQMGLYWAQGEKSIMTNNGIGSGNSSTSSSQEEGKKGEDDPVQQQADGVSSSSATTSLPPHVYGIADRAYRSMMSNLLENHSHHTNVSSSSSRNNPDSNNANDGDDLHHHTHAAADQSILVSGESGAGKTVTTKHIMRYLATLSQLKTVHDRKNGKRPSLIPLPRGGLMRNVSRTQSWKQGARIEEKILESNPILEAFGNARTVRNDNSSRFGKYIELQFQSSSSSPTKKGSSITGKLIGASISTYLLEKVRIVHPMKDERNYHIFYEVLAGSTDEERERYFLDKKTAKDFKLTSLSDTYGRRDGVDDQEAFDSVLSSMMTMGFTPDDQSNILSVTIACLHLSNLTFLSPTVDESQIDKENEHLHPVLNLLGLNMEDFNDALCSFAIQAGKAALISRSLPKAKAEKGLEALIKATYGALFEFIVRSVNKEIASTNTEKTMMNATVAPPSPESPHPAEGGASKKKKASEAYIGVLDIFGFESFKINSFEQLCINYCNEALQQQFNRFVFKIEQDLYKAEGIEWSFISFPDNQDVLSLIDKRGYGLIPILDDQCRAPGTTDRTFANDIYHKCSGHSRFEANYRQIGARKFGIRHYAGVVEYDTQNFVEKNKDELPRKGVELLGGSSNLFVRNLAKILNEGRRTTSSSGNSGNSGRTNSVRNNNNVGNGGGTNSTTVGGQFTSQLRTLRLHIDSTTPHYVRCLKPNDTLQPSNFHPKMVSHQLKCAGVLEAIRVSRLGYPQRFVHGEFVGRYKCLAGLLRNNNREVTNVELLERGGGSNDGGGGEGGYKKVCEMLVKAALMALAREVGRRWEGREVVFEEEKASPSAVTAGGTTSSTTIDLSKHGIQIGRTQVFLRHHAFTNLERLRLKQLTLAITKIQATSRRHLARTTFVKFQSAALMVQCLARVRSSKTQLQTLRERRAATIVQTNLRSLSVRKVFLAQKAASKWIQRIHRGRKSRSLYQSLKRERGAIQIQTCWRKHHNRHVYQTKLQSVVRLQCSVRTRQAKTKTKKLRTKSRDIDELKRSNAQLKAQMKAELMNSKNNVKYQMDALNNKAELAHEELEKTKAQSKKNESKWKKEMHRLEKELAESKERQVQWEQEKMEYQRRTHKLESEIDLLSHELDSTHKEGEKVKAMLDKVRAKLRQERIETNKLKSDLETALLQKVTTNSEQSDRRADRDAVVTVQDDDAEDKETDQRTEKEMDSLREEIERTKVETAKECAIWKERALKAERNAEAKDRNSKKELKALRHEVETTKVEVAKERAKWKEEIARLKAEGAAAAAATGTTTTISAKRDGLASPKASNKDMQVELDRIQRMAVSESNRATRAMAAQRRAQANESIYRKKSDMTKAELHRTKVEATKAIDTMKEDTVRIRRQLADAKTAKYEAEREMTTLRDARSRYETQVETLLRRMELLGRELITTKMVAEQEKTDLREELERLKARQ